jgi:hypothetical protein
MEMNNLGFFMLGQSICPFTELGMPAEPSLSEFGDLLGTWLRDIFSLPSHKWMTMKTSKNRCAFGAGAIL